METEAQRNDACSTDQVWGEGHGKEGETRTEVGGCRDAMVFSAFF